MMWLSTKQLQYRYPGSTQLLTYPDMEVNAQTLFIKGLNGKGKTTFIQLLLAKCIPTSGILNVAYSAQDIAVIPQNIHLIPHLSCWDFFFSTLHFKRDTQSDRFKKDVQVALDAFSLTAFIHEPLSSLSLGQQRSIMIIKALLSHPKLIIADEPTTSLDQRAQTVALDLLFDYCEKHDCRLLCVSHQLHLEDKFENVLTFDSEVPHDIAIPAFTS